MKPKMTIFIVLILLSSSTTAITRTLHGSKQNVNDTPTVYIYDDDTDEISTGMSGTVYKGKIKENNTEVAIKKIDKRTTDKAKIYAEIEIQNALEGCSNIIKLEDTAEKTHYIYLIMELADVDVLEKLSGYYFDQFEVAEILNQIVHGVLYMHKNKIFHRDLKLENYLIIKKDNKIKIADFGLSFYDNGMHEFEKERIVGTPGYMAPEMSENSKYHHLAKADVWSIGVSLYFLLGNSDILGNEGKWRTFNKNIRNKNPKLDLSKIPPKARKLIEDMLNIKPESRISLEKVLSNDWLINCQIINKYLSKDRQDDYTLEEINEVYYAVNYFQGDKAAAKQLESLKKSITEKLRSDILSQHLELKWMFLTLSDIDENAVLYCPDNNASFQHAVVDRCNTNFPSKVSIQIEWLNDKEERKWVCWFCTKFFYRSFQNCFFEKELEDINVVLEDLSKDTMSKENKARIDRIKFYLQQKYGKYQEKNHPRFQSLIIEIYNKINQFDVNYAICKVDGDVGESVQCHECAENNLLEDGCQCIVTDLEGKKLKTGICSQKRKECIKLEDEIN